MCLDHVLRRCMQEIDVYDIIHICHNEPEGGHYFVVKIVHKILGVGSFWPTMSKDVSFYVKHCDECQHMGRPTPTMEMLLQPWISLEPFEKWGIDFVGLVDPPSKGHHYILLCIDYVIKWAKMKALPATREDKVDDFLYKHIL